MQTQSAIHLLDDELAFQEATQPTPEDRSAWLTRYLFFPFKDHELQPHEKARFGVKKLRKGIIQPFREVQKQEPDYTVIKSIDPNDVIAAMSVDSGVSEVRLDRWSPLRITNAILRRYSESRGIKTGTCEIVSLRGNDDTALVRDLQSRLLPQLYSTALQQYEQLQRAVVTSDIGRQVRDELAASTQAAIDWAIWYYQDLQESVESFGTTRIGKGKLSGLDREVCAWLEGWEGKTWPEPRLQTQLAAQQVVSVQRQAVAEGPEQIQCSECGNLVNLLPNGKPPRICFACKTPLVEEAAEEPTPSTTSKEPKASRPKTNADVSLPKQ